jgi:hypothetical protein
MSPSIIDLLMRGDFCTWITTFFRLVPTLPDAKRLMEDFWLASEDNLWGNIRRSRSRGSTHENIVDSDGRCKKSPDRYLRKTSISSLKQSIDRYSRCPPMFYTSREVSVMYVDSSFETLFSIMMCPSSRLGLYKIRRGRLSEICFLDCSRSE